LLKLNPAGTKLEPFNGRFEAFKRSICSVTKDFPFSIKEEIAGH